MTSSWLVFVYFFSLCNLLVLQICVTLLVLNATVFDSVDNVSDLATQRLHPHTHNSLIPAGSRKDRFHTLNILANCLNLIIHVMQTFVTT